MKKSAENKIILKAEHVNKRFPGVVALHDVSFNIYAGQVNAIVGENGAGKSTLMKILSGVYQDYEGELFLNGQSVRFSSPRDAQKQGIAIIHQELNLVPYLSVAENIFLGREFVNKLGMIDYRKMYSHARTLLKKLHLDINAQTLVSDLRVGQQQVVEIAKALSLHARIIIMDEPTSAISEQEIEVLFDIIQSLISDGVAVVYITHKLDELFNIADCVTVLRDGKLITSGQMEGMTQDDIIRLMVGRPMQDFFIKSDIKIRKEVLRVEHLSLSHPDRAEDYVVHDISFHVNKGEIVGIFGLMGAGRTEMLETIFGLHPHASHGIIKIDSKEVLIRSTADAIAAGIGYVPEDRKASGLVLNMSVAENISLVDIAQVEKHAFINDRMERGLAEIYMNKLDIRTPTTQQTVEYLSGGNQQKVVIAKWLAINPKILLLDEPTRGIDVNAKNEIYKLISELAAARMGIVVVSSELPEIMAISDRILVLSEGKLTGMFYPNEWSEEILLKSAIPGSVS